MHFLPRHFDEGRSNERHAYVWDGNIFHTIEFKCCNSHLLGALPKLIMTNLVFWNRLSSEFCIFSGMILSISEKIWTNHLVRNNLVQIKVFYCRGGRKPSLLLRNGYYIHWVWVVIFGMQEVNSLLDMESSNNHMDKILTIFDHPPTSRGHCSVTEYIRLSIFIN